MGKAALYAALKLLFPPECCHCGSPHEKLTSPLCKTCVSYLEIRPSTEEILVTFEGMGPANSLMTSFKKGASPHLASLLAAYMAIHYSRSAHPLPCVVTAVPSSTWRQMHNCSTLLAKDLAKLLDRPFAPLLKRNKQMLRQEFLSREERSHLSSDEFQWKTKTSLKGKTVLLIDDTITTGTTLACCAERLWEASPEKIIKMVCVDRGYLQG